MLLVIDVGNTNVTFGVFDVERLVSTFRLTTKAKRTTDEFGIVICDILKYKGIASEVIDDVIISSVVPGVMFNLTEAVKNYLHLVPLIVGMGTRTGIKVITANPKEIGADRIVDAVAGYYLYGGPVLVLDFGTATTYDLITADGSFMAGVTAPGIGICADALWTKTAKLPEVSIEKPDTILARETVTSMQAGLVYGAIGQTEYIVRKMKEESGFAQVTVVATGELGRIIAANTDAIDVFDVELTLKGLKIIYDRQKKPV